MLLNQQNEKLVYTDGVEIEERILNIVKEYPEDLSQEFISQSSEYTINNTFSSVRQNILNWYPFKSGCDILEVGAGMGALTGLLCDKARQVTAVEMSPARAEIIRERYSGRNNLEVISEDITCWNTQKKFDYIVFIGVLEYAAVFSQSVNPFKDFMVSIKNLLKPDGILLFAIENRFGLKYWLGGAEDHLQQPFAGIRGYEEPGTPRTFSRQELMELLKTTGFDFYRFYNVLPDYKFPELIFADEYTPDYMNLKKVAFTYSRNSCLVADERDLYKDIIQNNVFPFFSNSFLVEASARALDNKYVIHVSSKGEVHKDYRVSTVISNDGNVYKIPVHRKAEKHIRDIFKNTEYLRNRGISILPVYDEGTALRSQKHAGVYAQDVFEDALKSNHTVLLHKMIDQLKNSLINSSPINESGKSIVSENKLYDEADSVKAFSPILEKAFIDMTFYNAFWENDTLIFYDQEWCFENIPLRFILYYAVKTSFFRSDVSTVIKFEELLEYIGVDEAEAKIYDRLEDFVWSGILYRQTDFYGADGYCNRYDNSDKLSTLYQVREENNNLEKQLGTLQKELEIKKTEIESRNSEIKSQKIELETNAQNYANELKRNKEEIEKKDQEIKNKIGHINLLLETEREYEREKQSRTYRLAMKFRKASMFLLPVNSKRRFIVGMMKRVIKNPKFMLHVINPRRIKNFFIVYKSEGMDGVNNHYKLVEEVEYSRLNPFDANQYKVEKVEPVTCKTIDDYEKMSLCSNAKVLVSIIIPVFNQFEYTYNCLKAIQKNSGDIGYEIIIADDCSTDITKQIEQLINGIKVIHNNKNLGFLLNCNEAAKNARGEYLIFLNNDTQVQGGWLKHLIDIVDRDETVGMTGSKLVYSDGWLQEAGGIVWEDASAWNYGNRKNPDDPEYNYIKEADYISGACILIRAGLWREIGGFDERFAPAYYEDTDLAFEVRKHGYKVVYQPLSVVVHFEGVSNGTDITEGQKAHQAVNQKVFLDKWKDVLDKEHFPNGEETILARDRSRSKKRILVVDHYVPHYDRDAGGKCTYMYLLLFVRMGLHVTFIGDNFYKHEPYTTDLNQHGIEVLYGNYYYNNWQKWLEENLHYFDYVYLQRPHISIKYIDLVKKYSHAKVFYFAHDLHHIREYREYELTKDPEKLKSSEKWKKIEYELFDKTDVGHVVGSYEQAIMQKAFPDKPVRNIPLYIYEDILDDISKDFEQRNDLLYVGGFGHPPNIDAVLWFGKEVFPKILEKYPDIKWHVVGGSVPVEVQELSSDNILIEGFMSDDDLHGLYRECRMAVVPLRVGAGVKGKVVEAAYYQIPLVTTTIGAEGLDDQVGNMVVEDDSSKMAELICDLYEDYERLRKMSDAGVELIEKYFTEKQAVNVLGQDML